MLRLIGINASSGGVAAGFESIASASGGGTTIDFTSIPQTYQHLHIRVMCQDNSAGSGNLGIQLNGDTGTNYARHFIVADGSTATAAGTTAQSIVVSGQIMGNNPASSIFGVALFDIHDYASTTKNTTIRTFGGYDANGSGGMRLASGLWLNTAAVTSIQLKIVSGNAFSSNSVFALYGIKGA